MRTHSDNGFVGTSIFSQTFVLISPTITATRCTNVRVSTKKWNSLNFLYFLSNLLRQHFNTHTFRIKSLKGEWERHIPHGGHRMTPRAGTQYLNNVCSYGYNSIFSKPERLSLWHLHKEFSFWSHGLPNKIYNILIFENFAK